MRFLSDAKKERYRPRWSRACAAGITLILLSAAGCPPRQPMQVWAWGANEVGQLGDGSTTGRAVPGLVTGVSDVRSLRAGDAHSVALTNGGAVWEWGSQFVAVAGPSPCQNEFSISIRCHLRPAPVLDESGSPLSDVRAIGEGSFHSLAVQTQDNVVVGWGQDRYGQTARLRIGLAQSEFAGRVQGPLDTLESSVTGVIAVAGGGAHSLALRSGPPELTVWAWGSNEYDQVGAFNLKPCNPGSGAPSFGCQLYQRQVAGLTDVIDIAAGNAHSLVLKVDGTVWAWGSDWQGQLGGTAFRTNTLSSPTQVQIESHIPPYVPSPLSGVSSIAAGSQHSVALKSDGTVWAWGANEFGQIGGGSSPVRSEPVTQVRGPGDVGFLTGVTDIAAGGNHTLALTQDGRVWAWGDNGDGQLGAPSSDSCRMANGLNRPCSRRPILVGTLPANVKRIAAGGRHSLALAAPLPPP